MLEASIAPSAAPAPSDGVQLVDKDEDAFLARRISSMTALIRSSNWPRYFVPATMRARSRVMTRLSKRISGTIPEAISCARPSTMAVLPTPASPMSTGLFFVRRHKICTTRRISDLRPMTGSSSPLRASSVKSRPKALGAGVLTSFFLIGIRGWRGLRRQKGLGAADAAGSSGGRRAGFAGEVRVEFGQNFVAAALDVHIEALEHPCGDAFALAQEAQQNMFGADVGMVERLGFFLGERQNLLHTRSVGNIARGFGFRAGAHLFFHRIAHRLQIEAHLLQHVDGHALAEVDQPQQQMLGSHIVVVEPVGFLARQRQHLLGAGREVAPVGSAMIKWLEFRSAGG